MKDHRVKPDRERAKLYIASVKWQFAKTMPSNPHEYTLKKWKAESAGEFEWFVTEIREYGYQATFNGRRYIYFEVEGRVYWTMGALLADTILINRAVVNRVPYRGAGRDT